MSININNLLWEKKLLFNQDYRINDIKNNKSELNFDTFKKYLLKKEIIFDNISPKSKKKDDEMAISASHIIFHLINILNEDNMTVSLHNKSLYKHQLKNAPFFRSDIFKTVKNNKLTQFKKKHKPFITSSLLQKSIVLNNNIYQHHKLNNLICFKNLFDKHFVKKINFLNKNQNNTDNIFQNCKGLIFFKDHIKHKLNALYSKDIKNIDNKALLKKFLNNQDNHYNLNKNIFSKKNINFYNKWKKAISHQILLSISQKENEAAMHLAPKSLGSIYIKIKMQKNDAILNVFSENHDIKMFLDNCVPFLKYELTKNGIQLDKINIYNSLYVKKISSEKNTKNINSRFLSQYLFYKTFYSKNICQKITCNSFIDMYA